jgi:predicted Zn-dependent protease
MGRFSKLEIVEDQNGNSNLPRPFDYDVDYYLYEARRYFNRGDYIDSMKYYSRAVQLSPDETEALVGEIRSLIENEEYINSEHRADQSLKIFPDHAELFAAKAQILLRKKKFKMGLALSEAALDLKPLTYYVWLVRGEALLADKKTNAARFCFEQALTGKINDPNIFINIGNIYLRYGYFAKSADLLKRALKLNPSDPMLWFLLGQANDEMGLMDHAKICYQQALAINSNFKQAAKAKRDIKSKPFRGLFNLFRGLVS